MPPIISVIIPAHNIGRYIGQCLSVMLEFRAVAMEVIVIDDGSTDNTAAVVRSFADGRLRLVRQFNRGPSAARNAGFRLARGEFILPFDGDDIPVTENWELVIGALAADPHAVLAFGARRLFYGDRDEFPRSTPFGAKRATDAAAVPRIFTENFMQMGSAFIRRDALQRTGLWNEGLRIGEDWELWCRLACLGRFLSYPALVIGARVHPQSAMGAPIRSRCTDPGLAAIDAIYSNPIVRQAAGPSLRSLKRKALAWQTYHWGTRLIRNGAPWAGTRALAWSISRDPSRLLHLCGFPLRRLQRFRQRKNRLYVGIHELQRVRPFTQERSPSRGFDWRDHSATYSRFEGAGMEIREDLNDEMTGEGRITIDGDDVGCVAYSLTLVSEAGPLIAEGSISGPEELLHAVKKAEQPKLVLEEGPAFTLRCRGGSQGLRWVKALRE
ncbi:MAG: glycosyltransferase family 2 protein [Bradyrhizobium sp.]|uniref:glycosyltransferase family 2 protein n=1 Tax=Bradyrhizobium sp. TaxID=376 RepID=UPI0025C3C8E0|nr:glycosyltransferase family 2 protein [Bradyrhizobium sp.]MBI5260634.1 glycosyltransferase family 2 protein [Bradyrhizobium sp.]